MYFQWHEKYNTGINEIDQQHQTIAEQINRLHLAKQTGDRTQVGHVLASLADYTVNHFSFEEALMEEASYAFLNAHRRIHAIFINRIKQYRLRFDHGEEIVDELLKLLSYWLGNHIEHEDKGYLSSVRLVTNNEHNQSWLAGLVRRIFR